MEITGTIKMIGEHQQVSDNYSKQNFVVTTNEQYPQHIEIQVSNAKCALLLDLKPGDNVNVSINIRGREWNSPQGETKYFNSIEAWKINKV
jgi:hypothetical protein